MTPNRRTCCCSTPAPFARRPRRRCSPCWGAGGCWKEARPGVVIGVGGCVASQEGEAMRAARPSWTWSSGPRPCTGCRRWCDRGAAQGPAGGGHLLPRDRKVRPSARTPCRGAHRLRLRHGGLLQVLHLLRGALHPRRGDQPTLRRRDRRGGAARRPGGAGDHPAGPERQRLPRPHARRRDGGPGPADPLRGGGGRHRAHPLHHLPPGGVLRQPDPRLPPRCRNWSATCTCRCRAGRTASWPP
jgi:hypothetical protein